MGRVFLVFIIFLFLQVGLCPVDSFCQNRGYSSVASRGLALYDLRKIWNPSWFQGNLRNSKYYEGWYFKIVSSDHENRFAFIPGISLGEDNHAFIQVINGSTGQTQYHRFALDEFSYSRKGFSVKIGDNHFSENGFSVDLGSGDERIRGTIGFEGMASYPVSLTWPGIMGWYRYVPAMETYHGVVSLDHKLKGTLISAHDTLVFDGGPGYVEKDWGSSMPQAWIWMQSNAFNDQKPVSFMLSVAHIPWKGLSFTGFLGYLLVEDDLYRFATYTPARLSSVEVDEDNIHIIINDRGYSLYINAIKGLKGELMAPVGGEMVRTIHESLDASLHIRLEDKHGKIVFDGFTSQAGVELVGDPRLLQP